MNGPDGRESVTIFQAMDIVGVSRRTIYNWMQSGKIETYRTAGGRIRIIRESLWRRGSNEEVRSLRKEDKDPEI